MFRDRHVDGYDSVQHLIQRGYQNIAFITLDSLQTQMQERLQGYERALNEHNLNYHIKEIAFNKDKEGIIRHITTFLERKKDLDAVLFATNYLGLSGLKAINHLGLKVPQDLAIIVFDDYDIFELYSPSITTIAQPIREISEKAISMLLARLNNPIKKKKSQAVTLPASLMYRDSTKAREPKD